MALRNTESTSKANGDRTEMPRLQNIKLVQETVTNTVRTFHAIKANSITSGGENIES
jgi:hypothetical protein